MIRTLTLLLALELSSLAQMPAESRAVIVFGDSITAGSALPKEQRAAMWLERVQTESQGGLRMINEGKGGRPTSSVAEFDAMLPRHPEADVLVIALGMNDSRDISDKCVPRAIANLRAMITKARAAYGEQLRILLVAPTNINKAALGPTKPIAEQREAKLRELGAAFSALASELDCEFVSLFGVVPESSLLKDGVHPDAAGNEAIAQVMSTKLRALAR